MTQHLIPVLLMAIVLLSACGLGGPRTFEGRIAPGMLIVTDDSNTVARITFDPLTEVEVPREGVAVIPDEPKKLAIGWDAGGCHGESSMLVTGTIDSIEIAVKSPKCSEEGVRRIQIHLAFVEAVDPANVTVAVSYGPIASRPAARRT